ncbi:hypothetical protein PLICRDRAFT_177506 [Plicaturopsis crispa FD-325 SS-3]|nr:hypothetical protein PLICRDRAFT_177506 [Plicaturopsis crispa FD-325 SS-3]
MAPIAADSCSSSTPVQPMFPVEIWADIFEDLEPPDLAVTMRASRQFHSIAQRSLYHAVDLQRPAQMVRFMRAICGNPIAAQLVQEFTINWQMFNMTANFCQLLSRVLRVLTSLKSLQLLPPVEETKTSWMLEGCSFELESLTTAVCYDDGLVRFLISQPELFILVLASFCPSTPSVPLPNTALPKLCAFVPVFKGPERIYKAISLEFLRGRPIQYTILWTDEILRDDVLSLFVAPLQYLVVFNNDADGSLNTILQKSGQQHLQDLVYLWFIDLHVQYGLETLLGTTSMLKPLRSLQSIVLVTLDHAVGAGSDRDEVSKAWTQACPNLKTAAWRSFAKTDDDCIKSTPCY